MDFLCILTFFLVRLRGTRAAGGEAQEQERAAASAGADDALLGEEAGTGGEDSLPRLPSELERSPSSQ